MTNDDCGDNMESWIFVLVPWENSLFDEWQGICSTLIKQEVGHPTLTSESDLETALEDIRSTVFHSWVVGMDPNVVEREP